MIGLSIIKKGGGMVSEFPVTVSMAGIIKQYKNKPDVISLLYNKIDEYQILFKSISDKYGKLWAIRYFHQLMLDIEKNSGINKKSTCKIGCSFCCHIKVTVTESEILLIKQYMADNGIEFSVEDIKILEFQSKLSEDERCVSVHSKCVFLENNLCSIYEARPMACRKYFSQDDPKLCDTKSNEGNHTSIVNHELECIASALLNSEKFGDFSGLLLDLSHI